MNVIEPSPGETWLLPAVLTKGKTPLPQNPCYSVVHRSLPSPSLPRGSLTLFNKLLTFMFLISPVQGPETTQDTSGALSQSTFCYPELSCALGSHPTQSSLHPHVSEAKRPSVPHPSGRELPGDPHGSLHGGFPFSWCQGSSQQCGQPHCPHLSHWSCRPQGMS